MQTAKTPTSLDGKTIIITGASDGIGAQAARQLHEMGASVVVIGRTPDKTKSVASELGVPYYIADFAKLSEVRELAAKIKRDHKTIDVLINNAGGIFGERELTVDGHEKTMQVNYLASFLLTHLLIDTLISSRAVVINTSSVANKILSKFDINDLENEHNYSANAAYGNSKLENILFTKELHARYRDSGISTVAFHPGNVATSFAAGSSSILRFIYNTPLSKLFLTSPAKGADTLIWLASSSSKTDWSPGQYYEKRRISPNTDSATNDPAIARKLWEQTIKMIATPIA